MSILGAIILGVLQGVTAFFPVSSSGHLVVVGRLLGADEAVNLRYLAMMHLGTLIAVLFSFRIDLVRILSSLTGMIGDIFTNAGLLVKNYRHPEAGDYHKILTTNYRRLTAMMLISLIPSAVISLTLRKFARMGADNLLITAMGMMITALALMISSFTRNSGKKPAGTRVRDALIIGVLQGLAVMPGVSRLGMILAGAGICGFARKYMVKYAFLISIPAILGGFILELGSGGTSLLESVGVGSCVMGILVASIVGYFALHLSKRVLSRNRSRGYACYCLAAGIVTVLIYLF
jgi:undecaprenyl-diphosphatase